MGKYRSPLALNVPARNKQFTVTLPSSIPASDATKISIQIPQLASTFKKVAITVVVTDLNKCSATAPYANSVCVPYTGDWICKPCFKFDPNSTTPSCFPDDSICHNGGTCSEDSTVLVGTKCSCADGFSGDRCERKDSCSNDQCNHGFIVVNSDGNCSVDGECTCEPNWQPDSAQKPCNECALLSTKEVDGVFSCFLPGTNSTATLPTCSACVCNRGYSGPRCAVRTVYGTLTFESTSTVDPSASQNEMINPRIVAISDLSHDLDIDQFNDQFDDFSDIFTSTSSSTTRTPTDITLSKDVDEIITRELALALGLDPSSVSLARVKKSTSASPSSTSQLILQSSQQYHPRESNSYSQSISDLFLSTLQTPNNSSTTIHKVTFAISNADQSGAPVSGGMSDLYNQWFNLQNSQKFTETPIAQTDASDELGTPNPPESDVFDPNCGTDGSNTDPDTKCPDSFDPFADPDNPDGEGIGSSNSSTTIAIIVGIVVGVGVVVLIFVGTTCAVKHAKKHKKWCFKPKKRRDETDSHLELQSEHSHATTNSSMHSGTGTDATNQSMSSPTKQSTHISATPFSSGSTSAVDLVNVTTAEDKLPDGWKKMKHIQTGDILYINSEEMKSQKHHPVTGTARTGYL